MSTISDYIQSHYKQLFNNLCVWGKFHKIPPQDLEDFVHDVMLIALDWCDYYDPKKGTIDKWMIYCAKMYVTQKNKKSLKPIYIEDLSYEIQDKNDFTEIVITDIDLDEKLHNIYTLYKAGFTQAEIASFIGCTQQWVSELLKNVSKRIGFCGS